MWYKTRNDFAKVRRQVAEEPKGHGALTWAKWEHQEPESQEHNKQQDDGTRNIH